ncbi:MAG: DUF91 domain-containing protein [Methanobacterium sp.]|uniref:endonuclease NucS domain-containing protein n=1 Tax=Methanobacterium sp. TaxID=2164 RepID=UPI002584822C|nr:endonuclease NucS domain-containing protein [Methanobacterium sp.]MCC7560634.1 DUF91 domain-containing protein [Methanobacterium sp.]
MEKLNLDLYNEGKNLYGLGEYEKALIIFKKLAKKDPNSLDYIFAVGRTLSRLRKDEEALAGYEKILNIQPHNLKALLGKVLSLEMMWNYEKAIQTIDNELKRGDNALLLARKGHIMSFTERNEKIILDLFHKAQELKNDEPYIWYLKSAVYNHYLEPTKAIKALEEALLLVSESKTNLDKDIYVSKRDLLLSKIDLLYYFKEFDKALKCCESLLESYGNDREAFFNKISIYMAQNDYDRALNVLDRALKIDPNLVFFLNLKGIIYIHKNSSEEALEIFNKITTIDANYEWGWANQVSTHYYGEDYNKAIETASKTLDINPYNAIALYWGSLALRKLGNSVLSRKWQKRLSDPKVDMIILEKNLQERLADELWRLKKVGYNLKLRNKEYVLKNRRRIDLLCEDVENDALMVVELKVVQASKETYLQLSDYIDSIKKGIGVNREVKGLVISFGYNKEFKSLIDSRPDISQIDFEKLGL